MRAAILLTLCVVVGCVDDPAVIGDGDLALADAAVDLDLPPIVDARPDLGRLGEFGEPCEEDAECVSGYCVEARDFGRICTRTCGECPAGFECAPIGNAGPDRTFVCLADQPDLCKPCETDRECDDPADLCLTIGLRTYCGEDCAVDGVCPEGYACFEFERDDGPVMQCAPADGEGCAPCRDADGDGYGEGADCLGADCDDEDPGTYPGADERCDGRDNDCDAAADEAPSDRPEDGACAALGLCRGTAPACVDGGWVCPYPEGWSDDGEPLCDGVDEDCDGAVDEDFDRQGDVAHCGQCGNACDYAHAAAACEAGRCVMGACEAGWHDADRDPGTGCEYLCAPTREGVEACDTIDNDCDGAVDEGLDAPELCNGADDDCDGAVDEGFDLLADPENCGACGRVCDLPDARARCEAAACLISGCLGGFVDLDGRPENGCEYACQPTREGVEVCDGVDNDCNGVVDDGVDLAADVQHCGRCGNRCDLPPNRDAGCAAGQCFVGGCVAGFVDANGDPTDGCEYACAPSGVEVCDGDDDDCDGRVDEGTLNACGACGAVPAEVCDGVDQDCDGRVDEGTLNACGACGAVPAEVCNGVDDDCDGVIDGGRVCGPYVQQRCRLFVGWGDSRAGPNGASPVWDRCPAVDRDLAGNVRCTGTRRDGRFARIQVDGDVNGDDQFAPALLCDDGGDPALAAYIQSHCALFWGHADREQGPDGSPAWGPCPGVLNGDNGRLRCTSSGYDGDFRAFVTVGDVNDDDDFGFAWICRDPDDPARAAALQSAVAVYVGWADSERGPPDGSATWGPCPGAASGDRNNQRCVSTRGDGRFHRMRLGGDVNDDDQFGFALRAR